MRIFTILLLLIFCIKTSEGQTIDQKDNTSVKIKTYNLPPASDFNTWDIGGNLGLTRQWRHVGPGRSADQWQFGLDADQL